MRPATPISEQQLTNEQIAARLQEVADLLESQGANPFRVRAYRTAAESVKALNRSVVDILAEKGLDGLTELPGIGASLARAIEQLAMGGSLGLLEGLRGSSSPERLFRTITGIGPELATRIHEHLGIESLTDLEAAAYDGRLARIPGMGQRRIRVVRESLAGRFLRPRRDRPIVRRQKVESFSPPVSELLSIDEEYRRKATTGRLPRIAPRRFNPTGQAWLPVLHTTRDNRHYTALYSNTARAHELGTNRDWVVIYLDSLDEDGQWTVVTGRFGKLRGKRIVRAREVECLKYYESSPAVS
jgi:predicted flap endonuclease-1-like 5' DNA nuclease